MKIRAIARIHHFLTVDSSKNTKAPARDSMREALARAVVIFHFMPKRRATSTAARNRFMNGGSFTGTELKPPALRHCSVTGTLTFQKVYEYQQWQTKP